MKSKLPVLNLKGSPRQIGYNHGKKARSEIEHNLEVYFRRFKSETELSRDVAVSRAAKFLEVIKKVSPEYAEMMKGVAAGSGQEVLEDRIEANAQDFRLHSLRRSSNSS